MKNILYFVFVALLIKFRFKWFASHLVWFLFTFNTASLMQIFSSAVKCIQLEAAAADVAGILQKQ